MIHSRTLHALEFPQITEHLASLCLSPAGRERALELRPLEDAAAVTHAARLYDESAVWAARPMGEGGFELPQIAQLVKVHKNAVAARHFDGGRPGKTDVVRVDTRVQLLGVAVQC